MCVENPQDPSCLEFKKKQAEGSYRVVRRPIGQRITQWGKEPSWGGRSKLFWAAILIPVIVIGGGYFAFRLITLSVTNPSTTAQNTLIFNYDSRTGAAIPATNLVYGLNVQNLTLDQRNALTHDQFSFISTLVANVNFTMQPFTYYYIVSNATGYWDEWTQLLPGNTTIYMTNKSTGMHMLAYSSTFSTTFAGTTESSWTLILQNLYAGKATDINGYAALINYTVSGTTWNDFNTGNFNQYVVVNATFDAVPSSSDIALTTGFAGLEYVSGNSAYFELPYNIIGNAQYSITLSNRVGVSINTVRLEIGYGNLTQYALLASQA
jgi:hypothetical protein